MHEPFYIVGPTAVGKTEVAVEAAALCGAEIVNADAFQVYAGLERLTAKPSESDFARVRHHLVGHVPRSEAYNVARFHQEASECLRDAARRERLVVVVAGSGLYVKALTHGLSRLPPAQPELRAELEAADLSESIVRLRGLDPVAAETVDLRNKRRVVRALEVCLATGGLFSDHQTAWQADRPPVRGVFLVRDKDDLHDRIRRRTVGLLDEEALEEVRMAMQCPFSETAGQIIGLREVGEFLDGRLSRPDCLERIQMATRRYAKRQMTWFRGESFAETINLTSCADLQAVARTVAKMILAPARENGSARDKSAEA